MGTKAGSFLKSTGLTEQQVKDILSGSNGIIYVPAEGGFKLGGDLIEDTMLSVDDYDLKIKAGTGDALNEFEFSNNGLHADLNSDTAYTFFNFNAGNLFYRHDYKSTGNTGSLFSMNNNSTQFLQYDESDNNKRSVLSINESNINISRRDGDNESLFILTESQSFLSHKLNDTSNFISLNEIQSILNHDTLNNTASIDMRSDDIKLSHVDKANGASSVLNVNSTDASLIHTDETDLSNKITVSNDIKIEDSINLFGIQYKDDYSINGIQNPLWIPNWGAVTDAISASGGDTIFTGGTLAQSVDIEGFFSVNFGTGTSRLEKFEVLAGSSTVYGAISIQTSGTDFSHLSATNPNVPFVNIGVNGASLQVLSIFTGNRTGLFVDSTTYDLSIKDENNSFGLKYDADYSFLGVLDPLWIPNWGAVTQAITNAGLGGENTIFTGGESDQDINIIIRDNDNFDWRFNSNNDNYAVIENFEDGLFLSTYLDDAQTAGAFIGSLVRSTGRPPARVYSSVAQMGYYVDPLGITKLEISDDIGGAVFTDELHSIGLRYAADYSALGIQDPLWIPNWGAVTQAISDAEGSTFFTGGTATSSSSVDFNNNILSITNFSSIELVDITQKGIITVSDTKINIISNNSSIVLQDEIKLTSSGGVLIETGITGGAFYADDYSPDGIQNDRWIPDWGTVKAYVDNLINQQV